MAGTQTEHGLVHTPLLTSSETDMDSIAQRLESLKLSPIRKAEIQRPKDWTRGKTRTGFVYDDCMAEHNKVRHYEKAGRTSAAFYRLKTSGTLDRTFQLQSRCASVEEILLFHTEEHILNIRDGSLSTGDDLYWLKDSTLKSAAYSAGCAIQATEAVLREVLDNAFVLARPPGHHANRSTAQGFCFFNNVAIAALKALKSREKCRRVLIVDWDVHHGNGTQECFYEDSRVLYISLHRGGNFYPGTGKTMEIGKGEGVGFNINIAWPSGGFGDADYLAAFESVVVPVASEFDPDLILVSAGFDSARHDPLGGLCVSPECFAKMTEELMKINSKVVMVLEGGYNVLQLADCVHKCVRALLGDIQEIKENLKMRSETKWVLLEVSEQLHHVRHFFSAAV